MILITVILAVPLIASFVVFVMANSLGAACLPSVGYGIQSIPQNEISNPTNGISYIWIMGKVSSSSSQCYATSTDMSFPTAVLNVLNTLMSIGALIGAFIMAYKMVTDLPHASNR